MMSRRDGTGGTVQGYGTQSIVASASAEQTPIAMHQAWIINIFFFFFLSLPRPSTFPASASPYHTPRSSLRAIASHAVSLLISATCLFKALIFLKDGSLGFASEISMYAPCSLCPITSMI